MDFNSIPVVNMAGRVIGLIPKSFIVILIENHWWYDEEAIRHQTDAVSNYYRTSNARKTMRASQQSNDFLSRNDNKDHEKADSLGSPRGSLSGDSDEEIKIADAAKTTDKKFGKADREMTVKPLTSKVTAAENVNMEYSMDKSIDFKKPMTERELRNRTINEFTGERDYEFAPES